MTTLRHRVVELRLRHTFRLSRGASDTRRNLLLELEDGGLTGLGEAAPIARYAQDADSAAGAAEAMAQRLGDVSRFDGLAARVAVVGQSAAEAAIDMALYDLLGKRLGAPLWSILGLEPRRAPATTFTIGIDTPEAAVAKVAEAAEFETLKVKLGGPDDRAMLEAIRDATRQRLRVDVNEGWAFLETDEAAARVEWLERLGVEMLEQPFPAAEIEANRALRRRVRLPIYADESVHRAADLPRLAGAFDGVNIKLMKCGGIGEALRMIAAGRALGLKLMLGCMVETSLAITAAAQIAPLVDEADLDGALLVSNDPYRGATFSGGAITLPDGPGLGVEPRPASDVLL
jgi:L-alanine-DL-glutamate epimerase-like enolase superfamily enzyme